MRHRFRLLLVGCLLLLLPGEGRAQSYAQQVWDQLQVHYKAVAKNSTDWVLQNYVMGSLRVDGTDGWTFPFRADREYIITGACDNDCANVDLVLKDPDGKVVAEDAKADDTPVLVLKGARDGKYTIEVTIKSCKASPCYFGFGVFVK